MGFKRKRIPGFRKTNTIPGAGPKAHQGSIARPTNIFRKARRKGYGRR